MDQDALSRELLAARQAQADAEFSKELAAETITLVAQAVQSMPLSKLKIFQTYLLKSLELTGVPSDG